MPRPTKYFLLCLALDYVKFSRFSQYISGHAIIPFSNYNKGKRMKVLITFLASLMIAGGALASDLECKSYMFSIAVPKIENFNYASSAVAEDMGKGIDQTLEVLVVKDDRIKLRVSILDESGSIAFDIAVGKIASGKYEGHIASKGIVEEISCTRK
jgi:hypothetical protein